MIPSSKSEESCYDEGNDRPQRPDRAFGTDLRLDLPRPPSRGAPSPCLRQASPRLPAEASAKARTTSPRHPLSQNFRMRHTADKPLTFAAGAAVRNPADEYLEYHRTCLP